MNNMDSSWLANFNNIAVENTASKSSLVVANLKLFKVVEKNKKEIKKLKRSLKHKDQQIVALRNYISEIKKENPITNDINATGILDSFENMKMDEEPIEPNDLTPEDVEKRKYLK